MDFFRREKGLDIEEDTAFFEENKVFLITAFIINPSFFSLAWNFCAILQWQAEEQKKQAPRTDIRAVFYVIQLPKNYFQLQAASGAGAGLREIGSLKIAEIDGTLTVYCSTGAETSFLQFRFRFDKYSHLRPFNIKAWFTAGKDGNEHSVMLDRLFANNADRNELVICSGQIAGIDVSGGISIIQVETIKNE